MLGHHLHQIAIAQLSLNLGRACFGATGPAASLFSVANPPPWNFPDGWVKRLYPSIGACMTNPTMIDVERKLHLDALRSQPEFAAFRGVRKCAARMGARIRAFPPRQASLS